MISTKTLVVCLLVVMASCDTWAVLVAGSNTYGNYRHQSDVFHSYKQLRDNGFPENRIITFAYDDIAQSTSNPFKGKVFNKPTYKDQGVDVYEGIKIDYTKTQVTPANFLAVLEGDKSAVKGKGTERVLESTSSDNVFIYFADHGAPGLIAFPTQRLYAKDLISTFSKMTQKKNYNKLVFYLEVYMLIFRHASQDQCSPTSPTTPASMLYQLLTPPNPHGDATAHPTMSSMDNTSNPALVIFSQSTTFKIPIKVILTRLLTISSRPSKS
jgi:hypothetical protein